MEIDRFLLPDTEYHDERTDGPTDRATKTMQLCHRRLISNILSTVRYLANSRATRPFYVVVLLHLALCIVAFTATAWHPKFFDLVILAEAATIGWGLVLSVLFIIFGTCMIRKLIIQRVSLGKEYAAFMPHSCRIHAACRIHAHLVNSKNTL